MFHQSLDAVRDELAGVLAPEERLLAVEVVTESSGTSRIERDDWVSRLAGANRPPDEPSSGIERAAGRVLEFPFTGLDVDNRHLLGGITGAGAKGSVAEYVETALRDGTTDLMVTSMRLAFLALSGSPLAYRLIAAVDRSALIGARMDGTFGQRGRFQLAFRDGSVISLRSGLLFTGPAKRILAALA